MSKTNFKRKANQLDNDYSQKKKRLKGNSAEVKTKVQKLLAPMEEAKILEDFDKDTIKLCSWNVNGIRAVIGRKELQDFITKSDPDILCINETKVSEENIVKLNLRQHIPRDYQCIWNCSKKKKGYSGTAIFTKGRQLK